MKTTIKANIPEPGKAVLSAKLFGEIVRRLPADDVHLTTDESNITVIQSGPSEFSLVGIPAENIRNYLQFRKMILLKLHIVC